MQRFKYKKAFLFCSIAFIAGYVLLSLMATHVHAAPVAPIVSMITQPDGSEFQALPWGDEWYNGVETVDGYTIVKDFKTGYWVYVTPSFDWDMAPQYREEAPIVGKFDPGGLPKHIRPQLELPEENLNGSAPTIKSRENSFQPSTKGNHKTLVLLVEFEDQRGVTPADYWFEKIFSSQESVKDYFNEVSFGKLSIEPAYENYGVINDGIIGWLTLENEYHPYDPGNIYYTGTENSQRITSKALMTANEFVNFAAFDSNGDGYLSTDELHIIIIVAGHEGAYGGSASSCAPYIWAHHANLDGYLPILVLDGKKLGYSEGGGGYLQFGEIHCDLENSPGHPATIGIIAHELGHDLRLPDLYDIYNPSNQFEVDSAGIGYWGLMSTGMWNRSSSSSPYYGDSPAHPTAWSRWYLDWLQPIQINASTLEINIPPVQTSGIVYQLRDNPYGVDWSWYEHSGIGEYYLLENRQKFGYDIGLPGSGLLIWHIDESVRSDNFANGDQNHRLVDLEQADGLRELNILNGNRGDPGDPFPGSTLNSIFNRHSNPSSRLYDGIISGVSVNAIGIGNPAIFANLFVTSFADVLQDYWCWDSIEALLASGITMGTDERHFSPEKGTTRAEMAVFLGRAIYGTDNPPDQKIDEEGSGDENDSTEPVFEDVNSEYWAVGWIEQLYRDGLTQGCSSDPLLFCPDQELSRDQMAVFLMRFLHQGEPLLPKPEGVFTDVDENHWAVREIEQLYREGYTLGCATSPDLIYCPEKIVTRAEIAVFFERVFNLPKP